MTETTETYERPNPANAVEALEGTKEALRQHGRTRGINFGPDGKVCLNGALQLATGAASPDGSYIGPYDPHRSNIYSEAWAALCRAAYDSYGGGALDFNDDPNITDEQVYALIDAAIAAQNQDE